MPTALPPNTPAAGCGQGSVQGSEISKDQTCAAASGASSGHGQEVTQLGVDQLLAAAPDVLHTISRGLRSALGLSLFGFDVIAVPREGGRDVELQVIDVNYFPSFKVPGAAAHVWAVLQSTV